MYKKRNGSRYFERKSRNQINKRISDIENGPSPDYPKIINRDGKVERRIIIQDLTGDEIIEHKFDLYGANDINIDQYLIFENGKQLYINRQGKDVINQTRKRKVMGWTRVGAFAISQFVRVGRFE